MSTSPDHLDAVRIPSGENAGQSLEGLDETERGRTWITWALRRYDWPPEFRSALETFARERMPLVWQRYKRDRVGRS